MHLDQMKYFKYTPKSRLDKTVKSLVGMIEGLTIDQKLNQKEIDFFSDWIEQNQELRNKHPFNEMISVALEIFEDQIINDDEKQDLLWLCKKLGSPEFYDQITSDIQRLHGVLGGVIADGVITEAELKGLRGWLNQHDHLKTCWPYTEVDSIITSVMADGVIDEGEQLSLLSLFSEFITCYDDKTITTPPILIHGTLQGLCANCPDINFTDSTFCFTGSSSRYRRSDLEKTVINLGGKFSKNVNKTIDYLIIGADGNPCWAYACYGRKVETAVNLRKEGHRLLLVHENDFHDAVADYN